MLNDYDRGYAAFFRGAALDDPYRQPETPYERGLVEAKEDYRLVAFRVWGSVS